MLLSPAYSETAEFMTCSSDNYMDPTDPRWGDMVHSSSYYMGISHPYTTTAQHESSVLTPISLVDNAYLQARPSPVLSHHSLEYPYIEESGVNQGLGFSNTYPEMIPGPTSSPNFTYQQHNHANSDVYGYVSRSVHSNYPLDKPAVKRPRRQTTTGSTGSSSSLRNSPVRILPHPEGLQRLEQERRLSGQSLDLSQPDTPKPRSTGRGRRDPQAEEEDIFVENLRAQNLSWKIVAEMFRDRFGKNTSEARLQMRMLRRRKSAAAWQEADVTLLHEAYKYWRTEKLRIISEKLQELGASQKYDEEQIQAQLKLSQQQDVNSDDEYAIKSPELEQQTLQSNSNKKRKRWSEDV